MGTKDYADEGERLLAEKDLYAELNPIDEQVKMFLFARWIATCYADTHLDNNMNCEHTTGFNQLEAISVLNREDGHWYKKQLKRFNDYVYPNCIKNGSVENVRKFLSK